MTMLPTTRAAMVAMALAGLGNLLLAAFWMFGALLGANGMDSVRGGRFLGGLALVLALLWLGGLVLARHLTHWGLARGWNTALSVALATVLTIAAWMALAFIATVVLSA
ncbi:hypothetical protein LJR129_003811 [Acidovorax sp. LjRoot129]|uniref:hypothetical protein n=1 Tax=Acidovorax sp. LjRoot129 TaxID=3342260 RepID=UPI003ED06DB7